MIYVKNRQTKFGQKGQTKERVDFSDELRRMIPQIMEESLNTEEIRKIAEILNDCQLGELELERDTFKLRLRKHREMPALTAGNFPLSSLGNSMGLAANGFVSNAVPSIIQSEMPLQGMTSPTLAENYHSIPSPMVGTFYRSPSPDRAAFVDVGSEVRENTTVCILEAMKVMNEIPAEVNGTIMEILIKDGQPVEFGQPLFKVKTK